MTRVRPRSFAAIGVLSVQALALLCLMACLQAHAFAQGPTMESWVGTDTSCVGCWSAGDNWDPPTKPGGPNGNYNVVISAIGPPPPTMDVSATINNLEIDLQNSLNIRGGNQLTITGATIANNGSLGIDANGSGTGGILKITNTATLSGSGLTELGATNTFISGPGTLINQQSIVGQGTISVATLQNQGPGGQILGDSPNDPLMFTGSVTNSGLIGTQSFGAVEFVGNTVQNAGGSIVGGEGSALLNGCTIVGGTLGGQAYALPVATGAARTGKRASRVSGARPAVSGAPTLNGVTITGVYFITSDSTHTAGTTLVGNITNNGAIQVTGPPGTQPAELMVPGAVTLAGTGNVSLSGADASLTGMGPLTNGSTHTIFSASGGENFIVNQFDNQGTLSSSSGAFNVQVTTFNNTNGIISVGSGTLFLNGGAVTNGKIVVAGNAAIDLTGGVTLSGVDLSGGGVVLVVNAVLDGLTAVITIETIIEIDDNGELTLLGTLDLNSPGELFLNSAEFGMLVVIEGPVALNGNGQITTSNSPKNKIGGFMGKKNTLTINVPSFTASGTIGDGSVGITIGAHTTVTNNGGYPLIFDVGPNNTFKNLGTLVETSPSGTIQIIGKFGNYNTKTNTLTGGAYNFAGTFQFDNANLVINAAKITLSGNGQIVNQNGMNGLLNFNDNSSKGVFTVSGFESFTAGGTFSNAGTLVVGQQSTFSIGGSGTNYNQTGGSTTVDGTLTVPAGGMANITGGTLAASDTLNGDVSVGNVSGAAATFIIGDSTKKSASVSVANDYTQRATGAMDVQIGGTTAGSQYSQLDVTGPVNLAGTLNLKVINKFKPQVGQTFTILNAPSGISGTFSTVNGTHISSNEHFTVTYDWTSIVLAVESGP